MACCRGGCRLRGRAQAPALLAKPRLAEVLPPNTAEDAARKERERLRAIAIMSTLGHK